MQNVISSVGQQHSLIKQISRTKTNALGVKNSSDTVEKFNLNKFSGSFESVKKQSNRSILQANIDASLSFGNEPLALLYKTAIEGLNELLEGEGFGSYAIQDAFQSGLDMSPQATADRIVSVSSGYFSQYKKQNPEQSEQVSITSFTETLQKGIDKGFAEAKEILDGLDILKGDVAVNIDLTYDFVRLGLQDFVANYG